MSVNHAIRRLISLALMALVYHGALGATVVPAPVADAKRCDDHPEPCGLREAAFDEGVGLATKRHETPDCGVVGGFDETGGARCSDQPTRVREVASTVGALLKNGTWHCSATLIAPATIVTAAHCLSALRNKETNKYRDVQRGEFAFLLSDELIPHPDAGIAITDLRVYPDYDPTRAGIGDLAVLSLASRVVGQGFARLNTESLDKMDSLQTQFVGYTLAGALQSPNPKIFRRCLEMSVAEVCESTFTNKSEGLNTCHGDSGGGVFSQRRGKYRLAGVVAWGDVPCADFGVSTRVDEAKQLAWLKERIQNEPIYPRRRTWLASLSTLSTFTVPEMLISDYSAPDGEVDGRGRSIYFGGQATVELWLAKGLGFSASYAKARIAKISGQSPGGNLPYWGSPDPFSVERTIHDYALGIGYRLAHRGRKWERFRPFGRIEAGMRLVRDERTGRYTGGDTGGRCDLFGIAPQDPLESDYFGCETVLHGAIAVGFDASKRKSPIGVRAFLRSTPFSGRAITSIGVGMSYSRP